MLNLKELLKNKDIQKNIEGNMGISKSIDVLLQQAIDSPKDNDIIVKMEIDGVQYSFENTLHIDNDKGLYLLESRLFSEPSDNMIGAYLDIFYSNGTTIAEYVDDVWSYADWQTAS